MTVISLWNSFNICPRIHLAEHSYSSYFFCILSNEVSNCSTLDFHSLRSNGYDRFPFFSSSLNGHHKQLQLQFWIFFFYILISKLLFTFTKHVSAAWEKLMPMKEEESVSVYISQPVPCRYSHCHCFISGLVFPALMAKRLDIMLENPGARQDCAMKPSLNSAWIKQRLKT